MTAPRSIDNSISARRRRWRKSRNEALALAAMGHLAELEAIRLAEREELWDDRSHRSFAEWVGAEFAVSSWLARRMIEAARVLPSLPRTEAAFRRGELRVEHVLELCRFATPQTEDTLVRWAKRVKPKAVRHRADVMTRRSQVEAAELDRSRFLRHWWMDDGRLGIEGAFPAHEGAAIAKALDRLADRAPDILDEDDDGHTPHEAALDVRRADALFQLATAHLADDAATDRATVVVHANAEALATGTMGCEIENGPAIHAETALRLACDARIEVALQNADGEVVGLGRRDRTPPAWLLRQLRHRDRGCRFPGCEMKRFLHAHHIHHWSRGGRTDLDNLVLVCHFHHKLVHEYGWRVELLAGGGVRWLRPGGRFHDPAGQRGSDNDGHERRLTFSSC